MCIPDSGRRLSGTWHRLPVCALLMLLLAHCGGPAGLPPPDTPAGVVHGGLTAGDDLEVLDLAVGPGGEVHLLWREWLDRYGLSSNPERIMYRRGRGDPVRWDPPMMVAEGVAGRPRIIVGQDGVHVLGGFRLKHWWLPAGGVRWQAQAALLDDDDPAAHEFDAAAVGNGVAIAYLRTPMTGESVVYGLRWTRDEVGEPVVVARYPAAAGDRISLGAPTLLPRADRLLLLWAANALVETQSDPHRGVRSQGHLYAAWSRDMGTHWTEPVDVIPGAPARTFLHDAAAAGLDEDSLALFAANGLFATASNDGTWSPPRQLAGYDVGDLSGSAKTSDVVAVQCAGQPLVAWVDGRYQRSDRRWWNPLGGIPWSDSPDWINNDLFVLSGERLAAALAGDPVQPGRLTAPGSYTADVAAVARGDHALLVWAGRARVKKSRDDLGAPPLILQRRVDCD